ncbi:hypothetical protein [uncultured Celeribacter sp.]|uniref:hypothetical protein n=1 Tax=uncultured Celeribacter sp. TaxID=1303376 RepID=UPI002AA75FD6|nr:hypothetical protein [uncultured Celeribacter sp.]
MPFSPIGEQEGFDQQAEEIRERLKAIPYFANLDRKLRRDLLAGKFLMVLPQKYLVKKLGFKQEEFDFWWNYLSQYTHVYSMTFYRIEANGRGTGLENEFDRQALAMFLQLSTALIEASTDKLCEVFPEASSVRNGLDSKFSPGPKRNLRKKSILARLLKV